MTSFEFTPYDAIQDLFNKREEHMASFNALISGSAVKKRGRGRPRKHDPSKTIKKARKPTTYNLFVKDHISVVKKQQPLATNEECMKEVAKLWRSKSTPA